MKMAVRGANIISAERLGELVIGYGICNKDCGFLGFSRGDYECLLVRVADEVESLCCLW